VTLRDSLDIGVAGSYDTHNASGFPVIAGIPGTPWGATASINYNSGPWTVGGYYQISRAPAAANHAGDDRLSAVEIGASYRFTTRVRLYGAWYLYDLTHDRQGSDPVTGTNSVIVVGLRAAL
jgi:predicted porin